MGAELLSAGVFIEEKDTDTVAALEAVSTSGMAIFGFSPDGPTDEATLAGSFDEYQRFFGGLSSQSLMGHQALAFYQNGGKRAWVTRITPSDAVAATAQIQSQITDQQIEQQDSTASLTTFTETASASVLRDNAGLSPLVVGAISLHYRAAGSAVTTQRTRAENNDAFLTTVTGGQVYRGRVDPMAFTKLAGATSPNGDILYRSVAPGRTDITVAHTGSGGGTLAVVVTGSAIVVTYDTGAVPTSSAVAALILASSDASALVTATAQGNGAGLIATVSATNLRGIPLFDQEQSCLVPGTVAIGYSVGGSPVTLTVSATTYPIATATSGGDTILIDLRSGRFSLALAVASVSGDNNVAITASYTPAGATQTLTTGTTVDVNGKVDLLGASLTSGGGITNGSYINVQTGAYAIAFQSGVTQKPHAMARILATYKINAWTWRPISKGAWAQNLKFSVVGNPDNYTAATAVYTKHDVTVLRLNTDTAQYEPRERYEEISLTNPTDASYFPDVINELSDLARIDDPGSNESVRQLNGIARTVVLTGSSGAVQAVNIQAVPTTWGLPIQPRTVSITYTRSSDSTTRTITDDGAGNLIGDVDSTYATTAGSGLGPNKIDYTTGEVNFRTLSATAGATLITQTYATVPATPTYSEVFGDPTKTYSYTVGLVTENVFRAGTDGTFTSSTFGRNQFTEPSLQADAKGLYSLDKVDETVQVVIPDFAGDVTTMLDQIAYAESRVGLPSGGDRFNIFAVPVGSDRTEAVQFVQFTLATFSKYAAIYWPWVKVRDPLRNNRPVTHPPIGHIAGIYARTDANRNVGKAPAGTVDGQIRGITDLEVKTSQTDRDYVYPRKVNPLIRTPNTGTAVWGSRTLAALAIWRQISAVRLFQFCEKSVYNGTFWVPFENIGAALWSRIKTQLDGFFSNLFSLGYFKGKTPAEAFDVKVDETNNTQDVQDLGQVITDIGLAPNKPGEFIRFRFAQRSVAA